MKTPTKKAQGRLPSKEQEEIELLLDLLAVEMRMTYEVLNEVIEEMHDVGAIKQKLSHHLKDLVERHVMIIGLPFDLPSADMLL